MPAPDEATIRRFLLGQLSEAEAATVEAYLETDPSSTEMMHRHLVEDSFTSSLRGRTDEPAIAPEAEALAERMTELSIDADADSTRTADSADDDPDATLSESAASDMAAMLSPPQAPGELGRLGDYRILRPMGEGGMGIVFEAEDVRLGRRVAVKVMRPSVAQSASARARFVREAKAAAAIEHDHVVHIHLISEERDVPFLVMPLLKGESLDRCLKREKTLPVDEIVRIGSEVAEGLSAAHERGLVHRDIKPANIWLESPSRRVKILDFGLARGLSSEGGPASDITQSGAIVGTPAYMSPEQGRGRPLDARSDLFSLGGVLYRAATGRPPFDAPDPASVLMSLASDTPDDPRSLNPQVPAGLSALIMRLLEKDPARRPTSAREVVRMLSTALSNESASIVLPAAPSAQSPSKSRRWRLVAAGVATLLLALGILYSPTIIRVATNKGEMVIEIDGRDDVEVFITPKAAHVVMDKGKTKERRFELKAGEYEVEFFDPESGARAFTKEFKVERGGKVVVKATMAEVVAARQAVLAANRKAMQWVLSVDGRLFLKAGERYVQLKKGETIPEGPIELDNVDLNDIKSIDDAALANLSDLPPCRGEIDLSGTSVGDAGIARLTLNPGVLEAQAVSLAKTKVTDDGVLPLKRFLGLRRLDLSGTKVTDRGFEQLRGQALASLDLADCDIDGHGFHHLHGMASLRRLNLDGTRIKDDQLAGLNGVHGLEVLSLSRTGVSDAGIEKLPAFYALQELHLNGVGLSPNAMIEMRKFRSLKVLSLFESGKTVNDAGLARLAACRAMIRLDVRGTAVAKAGVDKLAEALPYCQIDWDGGRREPRSPLLPNFVADRPPRKDLFVGELVVQESFDDATASSFPRGIENQRTTTIENGNYVVVQAGENPVATVDLGPALTDQAFLMRVRAENSIDLRIRQREWKEGTKTHGTWLELLIESDGSWTLSRGGGTSDKPTPMTATVTQMNASIANSKGPNPEFAPDKWISVAARFVGDDYEVWLNGKLVVHGTEPFSQTNEPEKFGPAATAINLAAGRLPSKPTAQIEIDHLSIWDLDPQSSRLRLAGDKLPPKDLFAGERVFIDTFDDPKATSGFQGTKEMVTHAVKEGKYTVSTPANSGASATAGFGPQPVDMGFALRVRNTSGLIMTLRNRETQGPNTIPNAAHTWTELKIDESGRLSWLQHYEQTVPLQAKKGEVAVGRTQMFTELAKIETPDPHLATGKWLSIAARFEGKKYELWINGKLKARGSDLIGAPGSEEPFVPKKDAIWLKAGESKDQPSVLEIDHVSIWRLGPAPAPLAWTGDKPPPKDQVPGTLIHHQTFDDAKAGGLPVGKQATVETKIEGGRFILTAPIDSERIPIRIGVSTSDVSFITRMRSNGLAGVTFGDRQSKTRSSSVTVHVRPDGAWQIIRSRSEQVDGAWKSKPPEVLKESKSLDPDLVAGKWVTIAGKVDGKNCEVWLNGKTVAQLELAPDMIPANDKVEPRSIFTLEGSAPKGKPLELELDYVAVWAPTPAK